jgi:tetratricopeptide (TPR) repeat protein
MTAESLGGLAELAAARGDFATAAGLLREGLLVLGAVGHQQATTYGLLNLGLLKINQGDLPSASESINDGAGLAEKLGNQGLLAYAHYCQAQLLYHHGQPAPAVPILEECIAIGRQPGNRWYLPDALNLLGWIAYKSDDTARASALLRESLGLYREMRRKLDSVRCVERLAALAADGTHAARLLGAALAPAARDEYDQIVAGVRAHLDAAVFTRAWGEGRALGEADWDAVVAELLTV